MTPYLRLYLAVRAAMEAASGKGINPKVLTIGAEQFAVLHDEDSRVYHEGRANMIFMGMDIQLSTAPNVIQIKGAESHTQSSVVETATKDDTQIGLFD